MLDAFGKYTMPIISRLTLIFAKPTLSKGADATAKIKDKIMANMDKKAKSGKNSGQINNLRVFFRVSFRACFWVPFLVSCGPQGCISVTLGSVFLCFSGSLFGVPFVTLF